MVHFWDEFWQTNTSKQALIYPRCWNIWEQDGQDDIIPYTQSTYESNNCETDIDHKAEERWMNECWTSRSFKINSSLAYDTKIGRRNYKAFWRSVKQHGLWFINAANDRSHPPSLAALDAILICCRDKILIRCSQEHWVRQCPKYRTQHKINRGKKPQTTKPRGKKPICPMPTAVLEFESGIWVDYPKFATAWFSSLDAKITHVYHRVAECIKCMISQNHVLGRKKVNVELKSKVNPMTD